jgi:6-pyruvoyltetrahydropterin/6-carboxytetrahydropterin synthase
LIAVTRCYRFPAAHVLRSPLLPDAENVRIYGKCANPNGHGHDYGIEVSVTGEIDAQSGRIIEPALLDRLVAEPVLDRLSHRMLNEDPLFADAVPTAENIARAIHGELERPIAEAARARLLAVRVHETRRNRFDYGDMP